MIRSAKVLRSARGQPCTARFRGICNSNPETTVWAHLNGHAFGKGAGVKAHDVLGFHACAACHAYYDVGHGTKPLLSEAELLTSILEAVTTTWVRLIRAGIVFVPEDAPKPFDSRPVKPRKPRDQRARLRASKKEWPTGRKLQSRNSFKRSEARDV